MVELSAPSTKDDRVARRESALLVWARRLGVGFLGSASVFAAVVLVASLTTERSYWARIVAWNHLRYDYYANNFAARPVANGPATYHFRPAPAQIPPYLRTVTFTRRGQEETAPLETLLASTDTTAFIVLKDDQPVFEGYFNGADRTSIQSTLSVTKAFGSALIGAAIEDGRIGGVDDPITRYLPELAGRPGFEPITIRHLLTMTSGLRYDRTEAIRGPFSDRSRINYDPDLRALALSVGAGTPPGSRWRYNSFDPLLIGMILERATGRSVSDYLSEKLWRPLGMEAPGSWSLDSRHDGFEKMDGGLSGRAIDFAKFGRLYLRKGSWEGRQILPSGWVEVSARHDPRVAGPATSGPGEEWARSLDYGYMWWIDPKAEGRFFAAGDFGQYIYVAPDRDAVLLRFGTRYADVEWISLMRELASQIP